MSAGTIIILAALGAFAVLAVKIWFVVELIRNSRAQSDKRAE